jgi:DNA sulfur modification protein DndD
MYIRNITLRNWKAYRSASFEFPKPGKKKNVVLIGAKNGYGKTSLLEAVLLCLYGRDAIGLVPRLYPGGGDQEKAAQSYDEFLERALHVQAVQFGQTSASVEITLHEDDDVLRICRNWQFSGSGKHRRGEEEVRIYRGKDSNLEHPPRTEDRDDFYRSYVSQNVLPASLAQFFFFDGEQVQRLAKRDMSAQVKFGIEGILGVPVLRSLQDDLKTYAMDRKRSARDSEEDKLDALRHEVQSTELKLRKNEEEVAALEPRLGQIRAQRDELYKQISNLTGGSTDTLKEIYDHRAQDMRERDKLRDRLLQLLREDLALALAGRSLRLSLYKQLNAEEERAQWESSKAQNQDKLEQFLHTIEEGTQGPEISPPLLSEQRRALKERLKAAWESLWHPPPASCATEIRHNYLGPADRALCQRRLEKVDTLALGELEELLGQLAEIERAIRKAESRISQLRGVEDRVKQLADQMDELNKQEREQDNRIRELGRDIEAHKATLGRLRPTLSLALEQSRKAQPQLAKARMAEQIAGLIDTVIEDAYPRHVSQLSTSMTEAYRALAHKQQVKAIEINPELEVRLLSEKGRDLRMIDTSAGEDQIFALALIAAVASVVQQSLPIIMDTPLARLDTQHRQNVLDYFTDRAGEQVILLSQPDEVHGRYYEMLKPRLCARYLIEHEELPDGAGLNRIQANRYFED